jgi:hypothetical protein
MVLAACGEKRTSPPSGAIAGEDAGGLQNPPNEGEPAEPDASVPPLDTPAPPSSEELAEAALGGPARNDVVALGVAESLQLYCGGCHSDGANGQGFAGGFNIGELIARGMIVPGSSATSPLMQNLLHGSTPNASARLPTAGDIALLSQFIDRLRTEPFPSCERLPFLALDEAWAALLADVNAQPEADRPFLRYLGVSYASNAGVCGALLDEQRHALFKLLNSLSTINEIHVPAPVDVEQILYRIDIRDYGWNREIDLDDDGSVDYADAWSAVVGVAGSNALELTGPEADALSSATGARLPFLPVNALVSAASVHDLYYSLVGIRSGLGDTQLDRGIDYVRSVEDGAVRRAAFMRDRVDDVMVTRTTPPAAPELDHWLFEQGTPQASSVYDDPLGHDGDWSKSVFRLPNGMMAFTANSADEGRFATVPRGCIDFCSSPERNVSIACHGCHAAGLLPLQDTIRDYVVTNMRQFDPESFAAILEIYPSEEELSALMAQDNARYLAALDQADVPRNAPDPISRVYLQFTTDPIGLEQAAAELGVTPSALRERIGGLPELAALADPSATISRSTLVEGSSRALCALGMRNRPATCP